MAKNLRVVLNKKVGKPCPEIMAFLDGEIKDGKLIVFSVERYGDKEHYVQIGKGKDREFVSYGDMMVRDVISGLGYVCRITRETDLANPIGVVTLERRGRKSHQISARLTSCFEQRWEGGADFPIETKKRLIVEGIKDPLFRKLYDFIRTPEKFEYRESLIEKV